MLVRTYCATEALDYGGRNGPRDHLRHSSMYCVLIMSKAETNALTRCRKHKGIFLSPISAEMMAGFPTNYLGESRQVFQFVEVLDW